MIPQAASQRRIRGRELELVLEQAAAPVVALRQAVVQVQVQVQVLVLVRVLALAPGREAVQRRAVVQESAEVVPDPVRHRCPVPAKVLLAVPQPAAARALPQPRLLAVVRPLLVAVLAVNRQQQGLR
ncbi:hypothetical protein [Rhizobium rhizoryzae]|uniref:hypothetical protein n=1 Tax=Rhizobium rhizoryzae TaxID=451876 RepID=UPI0028A26AE8|nr:hypothetical protein [Rhizobium rhizoryzae]